MANNIQERYHPAVHNIQIIGAINSEFPQVR